MGSGKTAAGRALASRWGTPFYDLDDEVEAAAGRSIAAIFRSEGEDGFRTLEEEALVRVARFESGVVATGGGAVLRDGNVAAMKASGIVVLLVASGSTLAARLEGTTGRPLLDTGSDPALQLATLASKRTAAYVAAADVVVDTDGRTPEEVAVTIEAACGAI